MSEIVSLVDKHDNIVGTIEKKLAHKCGALHRCVVVYIVNSKKEVLVQIRKDDRLDHSASGHVKHKESYLDAAKRELHEELGLSNMPLIEIGNTMELNEDYPDEIVSHMYKIYVGRSDNFNANLDEINGAKWYSLGEVKKLIQQENSCHGFRASFKVFLEYGN